VNLKEEAVCCKDTICKSNILVSVRDILPLYDGAT
jgi:hypothetical protein